MNDLVTRFTNKGLIDGVHQEKGETLMIPNEVYKPSISFPRVANLMGGSRGRC